jgi:para-nitrobenzyl esterase
VSPSFGASATPSRLSAPAGIQAPVPVLTWNGVRDALAFGPPVAQPGHTGAVMSSTPVDTPDGSEDSLTLNIWSPDLGAARLPVMVWIQGGTYLENHSSNPHYDGATLARAGPGWWWWSA